MYIFASHFFLFIVLAYAIFLVLINFLCNVELWISAFISHYVKSYV